MVSPAAFFATVREKDAALIWDPIISFFWTWEERKGVQTKENLFDFSKDGSKANIESICLFLQEGMPLRRGFLSLRQGLESPIREQSEHNIRDGR